MIPPFSWIEWIACLPGVAAAVWPARNIVLIGIAAIACAWIFGTAGGLLFPAAVGMISLLLLLRSGKRWRAGGRVLAALGASSSAFLCFILPVPQAPQLTGPHGVGTRSFELASPSPSSTLVAQVWYPARRDTGGPRSRWLPDPGLAPDFPFHRIAHATANSREMADVWESPSRLPVIFYEHSWTGHRAENVAQVEELASHGLVIVAVDHPGQAERVRLADGTLISGRLPASLDLSTEKAVADFESMAEECLATRIAELRRVHRALADGVVPLLSSRLELERVGIFGFSFGGTCALRACSQDPLFLAGANEDGFFLGDGQPGGPFLFLDQEMPGWLLESPAADEGPAEALTRKSELRIQAALARPDQERMILEGTRHESFCDRIFTCRIPRLARTGSRPAEKIHQLVTSRLADFFKAHLGKPLTTGGEAILKQSPLPSTNEGPSAPPRKDG